jgi:hypothetical protein
MPQRLVKMCGCANVWIIKNVQMRGCADVVKMCD